MRQRRDDRHRETFACVSTNAEPVAIATGYVMRIEIDALETLPGRYRSGSVFVDTLTNE
jgi:hypothetical protein